MMNDKEYDELAREMYEGFMKATHGGVDAVAEWLEKAEAEHPYMVVMLGMHLTRSVKEALRMVSGGLSCLNLYFRAKDHEYLLSDKSLGSPMRDVVELVYACGTFVEEIHDRGMAIASETIASMLPLPVQEKMMDSDPDEISIAEVADDMRRHGLARSNAFMVGAATAHKTDWFRAMTHALAGLKGLPVPCEVSIDNIDKLTTDFLPPEIVEEMRQRLLDARRDDDDDDNDGSAKPTNVDEFLAGL